MFHFQDPVVDWPDCVKFVPPGWMLKGVDQVQMLDEAKRRKSTIKTILRHWYAAQVPAERSRTPAERGAFTAHVDYLLRQGLPQYSSAPHRPKLSRTTGSQFLQVPGRTLDNNRQCARDFFDTFIDGTFESLAHNVDYVEEWNEYFGNSMPAEERQRFVLWSQAVAQVWAEEYRTRPGLGHIRLILANTAVGNDIPIETAQAASDYDALLGYHAYWPTRNNETPSDSWPYYEGRWTEMDATFVSHGIVVDWALTEAGPVLFYNDWPRVTLGPNDGWRHASVHGANVDRFWAGIKSFLNRWREWNARHSGRCGNPVLFTSGFSGWGAFQIHQPELSSLAEKAHRWSDTAPPPPPLPEPSPGSGLPRIQYPRVYNVLPGFETKEQALAVFAAAQERSLETVGWSYDDAGIGALLSRVARLYGIAEHNRQIFLDWYAEFYPGTHVEFHDLPG
jgi:hypothetical protein